MTSLTPRCPTCGAQPNYISTPRGRRVLRMKVVCLNGHAFSYRAWSAASDWHHRAAVTRTNATVTLRLVDLQGVH